MWDFVNCKYTYSFFMSNKSNKQKKEANAGRKTPEDLFIDLLAEAVIRQIELSQAKHDKS